MSEATAPELTPPDPLPPSASRRFDRVLGYLNRHPLLLPIASFAFGIGSFLLVQRGEHMAQVMAVIALLGWPWLLAEGALGRWIARHSRGRLPVATARFLTQQAQQELLFFSLPFLFTAMQLVPGQMVFVALAAMLAVASALDPLYWHRIAPNAALSMGFHAGCTFVAALVILPIAVKVPLETALPIAFAITGITLVIGLPRLIRNTDDPRSRKRRLLYATLVMALLGCGWLLRSAIPPAGLWVRDARIAASIDGYTPGPVVKSLTQAELANGLIAFVAVRAPQGLSQAVIFEWRHNGQIVDRIPALIDGGREMGFRTYSRKENFGDAPLGPWRVDLRTPQGQLIARRSFVVR